MDNAELELLKKAAFDAGVKEAAQVATAYADEIAASGEHTRAGTRLREIRACEEIARRIERDEYAPLP